MPRWTPSGGWGPLAGVGALVILVDQVTKALVRASIAPGDTVPVVPGCFDLVHGQNTGIAFGLFQGDTQLFTLLGALTIPLLVWGYCALPLRPWGRIAWGAILGGATGNFVDRLAMGHVTDFVDWYVGPYHWYAFNVADACIMVGVFAVILFNLIDDRGRAAAKPEANAPDSV